MINKIHISFYIGSRANFTSALPMLLAFNKKANYKTSIVLASAGVLAKAGELESIIVSHGLSIDYKLNTTISGDGLDVMSQSAGLGLLSFPSVLNDLMPDAVVAIGDRFDVLPWVISASYMNIPIIHTMGGELSGTIDEKIRHAISKLADYHFVANQDALNRLIKMGESADRVFNVGCPRIDYVKNILDNQMLTPLPKLTDICSLYKGVGAELNNDEDFLLVSYHPVTTEYNTTSNAMKNLLRALDYINIQTILLWPNIDAGSDMVSKEIRVFRETKNPSWLHVFKNLPPEIYIQLMSRCKALIGNSSSAVREGEYISTPSLNIGSRQNARLRGSNIIDCDDSIESIKIGIDQVFSLSNLKSDYLYGRGDSANNIVDIIDGLQLLCSKSVNAY